MAENTRTSKTFNNEPVQCRWSSYGNYRLIIWAWMMNETTIMFSPSEISHNGYYYHAIMQAVGTIFIGIPLVYSEICLAQYTNCDVFTMWNFFPLFRYVGFGTIFLIVLKTVYMMVITSWYLEYTFYSALDPPPWFTCDWYNDSKCMVKSINVSIFQHCLEAQQLFQDDCGMKTASYCFFEREIGNNNTVKSEHCFFPWKLITASTTISIVLFILSIRKEKFIQIVAKILIVYVFIVIIILSCVALSASGTWYASISLPWHNIGLNDTFNSITRGVLAVGPGCGIIIFISRDVPFRSPATMTCVSTSLFSLFVCLMFALISFSGIKTMSFFHGEEENVIELGNSLYFLAFASITEIMTYFDETFLWGFCWFSAISFCCFVNLWTLHLYLGNILFESRVARRYKNFACALLIFIISFISWPFFCSNLTGVLTDATELIQILNNILFSFSFYWIYGYHNHNVDIIFMIGIKASYFWKIAWLLNPIFLSSILYFRWIDLDIRSYGDKQNIGNLPISIDWLVLYVFLGIYLSILFFGMVLQIIIYYRRREFRSLFLPSEYWGPQDVVLFKSRKMFQPEIMTTEFLYRQVRIRGYHSYKRTDLKLKKTKRSVESVEDNLIEWSALTSN